MPNYEPYDLNSPALTRTKRHGRLSTFHRWPQYLFPSRWNKIAFDLEVPYAFSHHSSSFYWTRDDALNDVRWNMWMQPPCLNCLIKSKVKAKGCDRMRRQENSFGTTRCCTSCQQAGLEDGCIETIELRIDPSKGVIPAMNEAERRFPIERRNGYETVHTYDEDHGRRPKTFMDETIWIDSERGLRKKGLAIWKPINLHVGDLEAKAEVAKKFEQGAGRNLTHVSLTEDPARFLRTMKGMNLEYDVRDNMARRVAGWDAEAEVEDLRAKLGAVLASPDMLASPPVPISNLVDETAETANQLRELELDDVCEHWSFMLNQAQADLYKLEIKGFGRTAANKTAERWAQDVAEVTPQVGIFLSEKMKAIVENGTDLDAANEATAAKLTEKARYWFRIIPEMMMT